MNQQLSRQRAAFPVAFGGQFPDSDGPAYGLPVRIGEHLSRREANLEHPPKPVASHGHRHPDHAIVRVALPASRGLLAELRPNPDPVRAQLPPERALQRFRQRPAPALAASLAPHPPQHVVDETPVAPARLAGTSPGGQGACSVVVAHD